VPTIKRRALLGAAMLTPFAVRWAHAQGQKMPLIAYLEPIAGNSATNKINLAAFHKGLAEQGFEEGRNVSFAFWYADGRIERLPELAKEVVARKPDVILASTPNAARPLKALTQTIPVIFAQAADAVENGEVANPKRPEGNLTGIANFNELNPKRLEWLLEMVPSAKTVGYIADANLGSFARNLRQAEEAADKFARKLVVGKAATDPEIVAALNQVKAQGAQALMIGPIRGAYPRPHEIVALTSTINLPTMFYDRAFVDEGGLMSFGAAFKEIYRLAGNYVGRVLKGAKIADLPVLQPGSYELVVHAGNARDLGITIPPKVLAEASEVIH